MSDGAGLVFGLISAVITARAFGPSGKGAYAALAFLVTTLSHASSLGLGDASVVLIGKGRITPQRAISVSLVPVLGGCVLGALVLVVIVAMTLESRGPTFGRAVAVACLALVPMAYFQILSLVLASQQRIIAISAMRTGIQLLELSGLLLFAVLLSLHITGGMLSLALATALGLVPLVVLLSRAGVAVVPRWDWTVLRPALRLGLVAELGYLLMGLSTRIDILFVYSLAGRREAGYYSVALSVGQLVVYAAFALAFAAYPRLAHVTDEEFAALMPQVSRTAMAVSVVSAAALVIVVPVLVPVVFGGEYIPASAPAVLLVIGGLFWSQQWVLARALTARGRPNLQMASFGMSLLAMVLLDAILIPRLGVMGAALASVAAPMVGLLICVEFYRRDALPGFSVKDLLPSSHDFRLLLDFLRTTWRRR